MKYLFILFFALFAATSVNAQLHGHVSDETGEMLPFASVYIEGTSQGTSSNINGYFEFALVPGTYSIVFQYVGYRTETLTVDVTGERQALDVIMKSEMEELTEIVIAADAEDPAYQIIRNAQAKRKYYQKNIEAFACDVYTKGNQQVLKMPEKILGQEIGDFDGALDSNRQGIVYLSESLSKYYFESPDNTKELMISSKVSGDDQGYSFNSATAMEFDFYQNTVDLNRSIVSPIADYSMRYYDYELIGTKYEGGHLINKIKVIPKRDGEPSFSGTIYIVEDLWNIQSLDLNISGKAAQLYFIKNLNFRQVHIPLQKPDKWRLITNVIQFNFGLFGAEMEGVFSSAYSNYDLSPDFEKGFFDNEIFKVEKESNERDSAYWEEIRPMPLTDAEVRDYVRKDSIQEVRNDPAYMDSLDRAANKFGLMNLVFGYEYNRRSKRRSFSLSSPLSAIGYNTVQGYNANIKLGLTQFFDDDENRRFGASGNLSYGFAEKKLRSSLNLNYRFDRIKNTRISISGGNYLYQYNRSEPISENLNTIYSLLARRNYAKYFNSKQLNLTASSEIKNGIFSSLAFAFGKRNALNNNSETSYFYKDSRDFTTNDPSEVYDLGVPLFDNEHFASIGVGFTFRFNQKYISYPTFKIRQSSEYPVLRLTATKGLSILKATDDFLHLRASISDDVSLGANGNFSYNARYGYFWNGDDIQFSSYKHFNGNETVFGSPDDYMRSFFLLPYYQMSTSKSYFETHFVYNFEGLIMDRIPLLNDLGWKLSAGAKYLNVADKPDYKEFHLGIDNIGYKLFRMFRVDFVWSFADGFKNRDFGVMVGVKL